MRKKNLFDILLDKIPTFGQQIMNFNFLTIDTKGRIIIEDCDTIEAFTDCLLIVKQGEISLTFTGANLKLVNLSKRGSLLKGLVKNVQINHVEG